MDISPKKVSKWQIKFRIYNGCDPALINLQIVGKPQTEKYRTGLIIGVSQHKDHTIFFFYFLLNNLQDLDAVDFLSDDCGIVRLHPMECLTYRLCIEESHPNERIFLKLIREFKSFKTGRKLKVTYKIPCLITRAGISCGKEEKSIAYKY